MVKECGEHLREKIHVLYGGIDTGRFSPRDNVHAHAAANGAPLRLICVARFEEVKGHATLVEACRILRGRGVAFECRLIGDGPLEAAIRKQCAEAGLEGAIRFDGALAHDEVARRLAQSDVAVLATVPSRSGKREGIPNVLKEAMACELPVVASASGGIPELVEDGSCGFLLPPGDTAALAGALERLAADPELRRRLGRAGRERVLADFDLRRSAARRAELFTGAAGQAGSRTKRNIDSPPCSANQDE
jgi:glycosyltransferase involved in cell wall biosynthesis